MANKYLPGGALNPAWCDEQDIALAKERRMSILQSLSNIFEDLDMDFNVQLGDGIDISISKSNEPSKNMCDVVNTADDYEAKFNFIKNHSDTPEDLKLAREIIGLE